MDTSLPSEAMLMKTIDFLVLCDAMSMVLLGDCEVNKKLHNSSVILSQFLVSLRRRLRGGLQESNSN